MIDQIINTTYCGNNVPQLDISPVALKSGDEIYFHGPQFSDLKDKALIKELKEKNDKLQKELKTAKQCMIDILALLERYQQEQQKSYIRDDKETLI